MLHRILGGVLLVLIGVLMAHKFAQLKVDAPSNEPSFLKVLTLEQIQNEIKVGDQKLVLINFWASWCVPCRKEFPELIRIKKDYQAQGVKVVFISADTEEQKGEALAFLKSQGADFQSYYRGSKGYEDFDVLYPGWNGALPSNVIYDSTGELLDSWYGETTGAEFESRLKKHL